MSEYSAGPWPDDASLPGLYIPPEYYNTPAFRMQQPRRIALSPAWLFDTASCQRLRMGHEALGGSDAWNCYLGGPTDNAPAGNFHAHHMATGYEIYRMPLEGDGFTYVAREFLVEEDPDRYEPMAAQRPPDDAVLTEFFALLLDKVVQSRPLRL